MTPVSRCKNRNPSTKEQFRQLLDGMPARSNEIFRAGLTALAEQAFATALLCFEQALAAAGDEHELAGVYQACAGLAKLKSGDESGISLCRRAAYFERNHVVVFAVLVYAELLCANRERAVNALHQGLRLAPGNALLLQMEAGMGSRRKPYFTRLQREHWLNYLAGKLSYRKPILNEPVNYNRTRDKRRG